jgi:hypothetical protein
MPGYELLGDEELALVHEVFTQGAVLLRHGFDARRHGLYMTRDFEMEFARRVQAPHSLAVSSATAGLKIALRALGVRPGDEVITQAFTYIATVEAIIEAGARPVIVEVARLPANTILVNDVTTAAYWGWYYWQVSHPERYLYPAHAVSLGYGLPAGLGAAFAGQGPVVVLCGDGGIGYCLSELSTAALYDLPIVAVVFNDAGYGLFRHRQQHRFGRTALVDFHPADYAAIARGHGIASTRAELGDLPDAVERAVMLHRPALIEVIGRYVPPFDN